LSHCRWKLLPKIPPEHSLCQTKYPTLIAQLLYNRSIGSVDEAKHFINADSSLSADPFLLSGMEQAVSRIYRALLSGENIAIYGDYDVDGITSTALLVQGLSALGGNAMPYIPHRLTEGYGLTVTALEKLHNEGISLVITVDCGITSIHEVNKARKWGLDIIITDHHTPLPEIPQAAAVIDPKLPDSAYPSTGLAGVGVAYKLFQAVTRSLGKETLADAAIDLVAIGTIADISPLVGENRFLVQEGLRAINASPRLGLRKLAEQLGLTVGSLKAENISWNIAPCLNAAGRLAHAHHSYDLLCTTSETEAAEMALWLQKKNAERQEITKESLEKARNSLLEEGLAELLFASDSEYHLGIAGLVAGRLTEEFYRPSIVVRSGEKSSSGSCRSIPEFNIIAALTEASDLMTHFGGHSQAAGFTLPTKNLPKLKEHLLKTAEKQLGGVELAPAITIDAQVPLTEVGGNAYNTMQRLAPFGERNPQPIFLSKKVEVLDCRLMGSSGDHVRLKLRQGNSYWDAVGFRLGNHIGKMAKIIDVVYNLEIDHWNGHEKLRLNLLDFAPSA